MVFSANVVQIMLRGKVPLKEAGRVQLSEDSDSKLFLGVSGKTVAEDQSLAKLMKQTSTYRPSSATSCNGGYIHVSSPNGNF